MLDIRAEQHENGQAYQELYEAVSNLKRRHDLHPCSVRPGDGLALRRDSEREAVQDLVKRFRDLPRDQQRRLPALLNSLAQLEVVVGDLEASLHDFQEVARLVVDPISQAEAHHNIYRTALERCAYTEALAALRRAAALDPAAFEPFPLVRYEPQQILSAGCFGVSFLCKEKPSGAKVVIRALRMDSLDREVGPVFHDLAVLQDLDHPAIARIRTLGRVGEDSERTFLVTDFFDGITLSEHVARHGPLSPQDWLAIAWPVARALQAAHGRGVLHRSLCPSSLLIGKDKTTDEREVWRVKLLDTGFGLKRTLIHATASHAAARTQTAPGRSLVRIIAFAAPEIAAKPKGQVWIGPHTDVYSFGRLCVFALTGQTEPHNNALEQLPEEWLRLLGHCTTWVLSQRPPHFGIVLDQIASLAPDGMINSIERDLNEVTVAELNTALQTDPANASVLANRGIALARQGELAAAIADFSRGLELQPTDASLWRRRALAYVRNDELALAIADYTHALELEPRNLEALANRGLSYARLNEHDKAIADYNEAIRLSPKDGALWYNRGNAYYCKNDFDRAISDYTEAIHRDPQNLWAFGNRGRAYLIRGDHTRAAADFTHVLYIDPNNIQARADRAAAHLALGRVDKALADYTQAIQTDPGAALYYARSLAHANAGDLDAAIADCSAALALNASFADAWLFRGNARVDRGDFAEALTDLNEAVHLNPVSAPGYFARGKLLARMGKYIESIADFTKAIELDPNASTAYFHRGTARAASGDIDGALADFSATIAAEPGFSPSYYNRANLRCERREYAEALIDYTAALRLAPDDVAALLNRGKVYAILGETEKAIADNVRALELAPDDARACNNLAWLWATAKQPELRNPARAIECARKACTASGEQEPGHLDTLAAAYASAGQFAEAVETQRKATELAPLQEQDGYRERLALYEAGQAFVQE